MDIVKFKKKLQLSNIAQYEHLDVTRCSLSLCAFRPACDNKEVMQFDSREQSPNTTGRHRLNSGVL